MAETARLDGAAQQGVQERFRVVMATVCTPVSVVTAMTGAAPHGTTVSAFASLSMDPPMVLVSLGRDSDLFAVIQVTRTFGINVLGSAQSALASAFARKGGAGKFAGVPWDIHEGIPRLADVAGFLLADVEQFARAGDRVIILGLVRAADCRPMRPLIYHERVFGTYAALDEEASG